MNNSLYLFAITNNFCHSIKTMIFSFKTFSVFVLFISVIFLGCSSIKRQVSYQKNYQEAQDQDLGADRGYSNRMILASESEVESLPIKVTPEERANIKKVSKSLHAISIEMNQETQKWIQYFTERDRERFQRFLIRGEQYREIVENVLEENGLPGELYYLAMIESGYQNHATSRASAVGVWQFIRGTGKRYGLTINKYIDERRDPIRATEAAVRYLRDLFNVFGSWHLAMAGYNAGEFRIVRSIFKSKSRDFWTLSRKKSLPRETRNYVPKFLAAVEIGTNPEKYGFTVPEAESYPDLKVVNVPGPLNLRTLANAAGVPEKEIVNVNPHLISSRIPAGADGYDIWVPIPLVAHVERAIPRLSKIAKQNYSERSIAGNSNKIHRVRRGENLSWIADKYGLSLARLKSLNNLRGNRIYPGMRLELSAKTYVSSNSKYYQVKRGDNLINIAQKFGLSLGKLKRLNGLRSNNIFVGTKLKITPSSIFHYRVKRGDNLTQIARAFGMSVYQLRKLNGLTSNRIYAGARLKVESGSANIIKYKVRSGDNLTKIAQKFDSSIRSIKRLNNLAGNRIFRGQVLTVKSSTDGV